MDLPSTEMDALADLTLDELRPVLAPYIAAAAVFDGWSTAAVDNAAAAASVDRRIAIAAFPGGAMDMVAAWIALADADMAKALPMELLTTLPVRERIKRLVCFRLDWLAGQEEALRRAQSIMAMPQNLAASARLGWRSADTMWRLAGDQSTDFNHYSKRAILAAIYAATLAVFAGDHSDGKADTGAFLDRRLGEVMRFEKAKAQILRGSENRFSMARFLGRLRYPAA